MRVALGLTLCFLYLACASAQQPWRAPTAQDTHDDPEKVRPKHCNADMGTWWPLSQAEAQALAGLEQAKAGDAHTLLALALFASGEPRDAKSYQRYTDALDRFVEEVRPKVEGAKDDWHRGYELHRAMHSKLLGNKSGGLNNYVFEQSRVSTIFDTHKYNCISSAMLFTVLASAFQIPARGVLVPTHAFVELGPADAKVLEVETTSDTGFDHVHDQRFYDESAERWSADRGLAAVTFEQYQAREVVPAYQLMAKGMLNQTSFEQGATRNRLLESSAMVNQDDAEAQLNRLYLYVEEANAFMEKGAFRTTTKMYECVGSAVRALGERWRNNGKVAQVAAWNQWYQANALSIVGRGAEAVPIANRGLATVDTKWEDGASLQQNFMAVLMDQMLMQLDRKQYQQGVEVMNEGLAYCQHDATCAGNLEVLYQNWYVEHHNQGNWPRAREVLQQCVAKLPNSSGCRDTLTDLESRHRF